jgi:hypothetical protein
MTEPSVPADPQADGRPFVRLSNDELAYHKTLVAQVKWAQDVQARIAGIQSAWQIWAEHLQAKYGFEDGDVLTEDGAITTQVNQIPGKI